MFGRKKLLDEKVSLAEAALYFSELPENTQFKGTIFVAKTIS